MWSMNNSSISLLSMDSDSSVGAGWQFLDSQSDPGQRVWETSSDEMEEEESENRYNSSMEDEEEEDDEDEDDSEEEKEEEKNADDFNSRCKNGFELLRKNYQAGSLMLAKFALDNNLSCFSMIDIHVILTQLYPKVNNCFNLPSFPNFPNYHSWQDLHNFSPFKLRQAYLKPDTGKGIIFCRPCAKILSAGTEMCSCGKREIGKFYHYQPSEQLGMILQRTEIRDLIVKREHLKSGDSKSIGSLADGQLYKRYSSFFSSPSNISFSISVDCITILKSSNLRLWLVRAFIHQLPVSERFKIENSILLAVAYDKIKPNFNLILSLSEKFFDNFLKEGMNFVYYRRCTSTSDSVSPLKLNFKGMPLFIHGGTQARAMVLNMAQFNQHYGCTFCDLNPEIFTISKALDEDLKVEGDETDSVPVKRRRLSSKSTDENNFLFQKYAVYSGGPLKPNLRSVEEVKRLGDFADLNKKSKEGVLGTTVVSKILPDFIKGTVVEPDEIVFSGVVKRMLELLFGERFADKKFSHHGKVTKVAEYLSNLKAPSSLNCSFKNNFPDLEGDELKNWFFHFSIPILKKVGMSAEMLNHFSQLVEAVFLLYQGKISLQDLSRAQILIQAFVKDFGTFYGEEHVSYNVHTLLHLPEIVALVGPFAEHSHSELETLNKKMLVWAKGTRSNPEKKITEFTFGLQNMHLIFDKMSLSPDFLARKKKQRVERATDVFLRNELVRHNLWVLSEYQEYKKYKAVMSKALKNSAKQVKYEPQIFTVLKKGEMVITSKSDKFNDRNISYCVEYGEKGEIGFVEFFSRHTYELLAVIRKCQNVPICKKSDLNNAFTCVKVTTGLCVIDVGEIRRVCTLIKLDNDYVHVKYELKNAL